MKKKYYVSLIICERLYHSHAVMIDIICEHIKGLRKWIICRLNFRNNLIRVQKESPTCPFDCLYLSISKESLIDAYFDFVYLVQIFILLPRHSDIVLLSYLEGIFFSLKKKYFVPKYLHTSLHVLPKISLITLPKISL